MNEIAGYDICGMYNGTQPYADYVLMRFKAVRPFTIPAGMSGSAIWAEVESFGTPVFIIKKNDTQIGTATFNESTTSTISFANAVSFAIGEVLYLVGASSPDTRLSGFGWTIVTTKDRT